MECCIENSINTGEGRGQVTASYLFFEVCHSKAEILESKHGRLQRFYVILF